MAMHTAMVVNRFLDLNLASDKGAVTAITVRAPIKGEGLKVTTIDRKGSLLDKQPKPVFKSAVMNGQKAA